MDVKKIRESVNLTQSEFGKRLNLSLRTIQKYERAGEVPPSIQKLIRYEFGLHKEKDSNQQKVENNTGSNQSETGKDKKIVQLKEQLEACKRKVDYLQGQVDLLKGMVGE